MKLVLICCVLVVWACRCYWRGNVTFSDGATGRMGFSSCERTSRPHQMFLDEVDGGDAVASNTETYATPLHFVHGVIHDHSSGAEYVIEPRLFQEYRRSNVGREDDTRRRLDEASGVTYPYVTVLSSHYSYESSDLEAATGTDHNCGVHGHGQDEDEGHDHDHDHDHDADSHEEPRRRHLSWDGEAEVAAKMSEALRGARADEEAGRPRRLSTADLFVRIQVSNDFQRCTDLGASVSSDTLTLFNIMGLLYERGVTDGFSADSASARAETV